MIDLLCLVADKNMEAVVGEVLERPRSLGIRQITKQILVHPQRDSACFEDPVAHLRNWRGAVSHALVIFDRAWEGAPSTDALRLEQNVDRKLAQLGAGWAKGIAIDPELEVWLFRDSPRLDAALGWRNRQPTLREELARIGLWNQGDSKPADPKRAIEWALRQVRLPRSSSIYRDLAAQLGIRGCADSSFLRFQSTLRGWFPAAQA